MEVRKGRGGEGEGEREKHTGEEEVKGVERGRGGEMRQHRRGKGRGGEQGQAHETDPLSPEAILLFRTLTFHFLPMHLTSNLG